MVYKMLSGRLLSGSYKRLPVYPANNMLKMDLYLLKGLRSFLILMCDLAFNNLYYPSVICAIHICLISLICRWLEGTMGLIRLEKG